MNPQQEVLPSVSITARNSTHPHRFHAVLFSPLGEVFVQGDGTHVTGLHFDGQKYFPSHLGHRFEDDPLLLTAVSQLKAYFEGRLLTFDLPLLPAGTAFQRNVWKALLEIPYGESLSYGALAAAAGYPGCARAVGAAVGRNPISIVVPCHRVLGGKGALTGYAGGLERKQALLTIESRETVTGARRPWRSP